KDSKVCEIPFYEKDVYTLKSGERLLIKCGVSMALPQGYEAQVRPRSGLALKHGITIVNSPGTIDSDFRGELGVVLLNTDKSDFTFKANDSIAQLVIPKLPEVEGIEVEEFSNKEDRGGAFGSSAS